MCCCGVFALVRRSNDRRPSRHFLRNSPWTSSRGSFIAWPDVSSAYTHSASRPACLLGVSPGCSSSRPSLNCGMRYSIPRFSDSPTSASLTMFGGGGVRRGGRALQLGFGLRLRRRFRVGAGAAAPQAPRHWPRPSASPGAPVFRPQPAPTSGPSVPPSGRTNPTRRPVIRRRVRTPRHRIVRPGHTGRTISGPAFIPPRDHRPVRQRRTGPRVRDGRGHAVQEHRIDAVLVHLRALHDVPHQPVLDVAGGPELLELAVLLVRTR